MAPFVVLEPSTLLAGSDARIEHVDDTVRVPPDAVAIAPALARASTIALASAFR